MPVVIRVALPLPMLRTFDYEAPVHESIPVSAIGCRVLVPFGRQEKVGFVVAILEESTRLLQLKVARCWLDQQPIYTDELWYTLNWAAQYYAHALGEVLHAALPTVLRQAKSLPKRASNGLCLSKHGYQLLAQGKPRVNSVARRLMEQLESGAQLFSVLEEVLPGYKRVVKKQIDEGTIEEVLINEPVTRPLIIGPPLNSFQRASIDTVLASAGKFQAFLLNGVTGSGKTEVYIELIRAALEKQQQSLVLVPEISLTPQALKRYELRLGISVAVMHSGMSDTARYKTWLAVKRGEVGLILGTRSAIFMPLLTPGLFVVDEEHDTSYKQQDGFRYSARDLALVRARALSVPVVLGSATPSLESVANVAAKRYVQLELPQPANARDPARIEILDSRRQPMNEGLSLALLQAIDETLARGEQVLVFRNRRGYSPLLMCHECGWHSECLRCDAHLVLHKSEAKLRCHHCGFHTPMPTHCPSCFSFTLHAVGLGTERIEHILAQRFPTTPRLRIDSDTVHRDVSMNQLLDLPVDKPALLIGTQMLAKGHDLPNLTLVCIIGVDEGLFGSDFRGSERLAQLVVQVAGRSGRASKPGRVLLQTRYPQHPLLQVLATQGYRFFTEQALDERKTLGLPPYAAMAVIRAEAKASKLVDAFLTRVCNVFEGEAGILIRGPFPAPMPRRAGFLRGQVILECAHRASLQAVLAAHIAELQKTREGARVRWSVDVDPIDLN